MITSKPLGRVGTTLCAPLNYAVALAGESALISGEQGNAAEGLRQYGQFVGTWRCEPAFRDAEGIWQQPPAHLARVTFHNITADHFDWKYEASAPGDGENWQLYSTLSCTRQDA